MFAFKSMRIVLMSLLVDTIFLSMFTVSSGPPFNMIHVPKLFSFL
jgi:hypothetical protein